MYQREGCFDRKMYQNRGNRLNDDVFVDAAPVVSPRHITQGLFFYSPSKFFPFHFVFQKDTHPVRFDWK